MKNSEKPAAGLFERAAIRKQMAEVDYHKYDTRKKHRLTYRTNRFFKPT